MSYGLCPVASCFPSTRRRPPSRQLTEVILVVDQHPWVVQALNKISELETLPANWDGSGSPGLQVTAVSVARRILTTIDSDDLPSPHVCPMSGGGLGFHWQTSTKELELSVLPDGSVEYLKVLEPDSVRNDATEYGTVPENIANRVELLLNWLTLP
jgi:hypothetical protein